jgi:hypothetical protein
MYRLYSKAVAVGNHVVWTDREVLPVPFLLPGPMVDGAEFGIYHVPGNGQYCIGYRADFQRPAGASTILCSVGLYNGDDELYPGSVLNLNGTTAGADKRIYPAVPMPPSSYWKLKVSLDVPPEVDDDYIPEDLTVTLFLRFSNGPVPNTFGVDHLSQRGVGFDEISYDLPVYP